MFSLKEIRNLIVLGLIAIGFIAVYFAVQSGTLAWLTGKPCRYGDVKIPNGQTYHDESYDVTIRCTEGEISYE